MNDWVCTTLKDMGQVCSKINTSRLAFSRFTRIVPTLPSTRMRMSDPEKAISSLKTLSILEEALHLTKFIALTDLIHLMLFCLLFWIQIL